MAHILELFDPSKYVAAHELRGRDVTVTIKAVRGQIVEGEGNRKNKRPVLEFANASKPMVLNKTNAKILIQLYGADYTKWAGKRVTLYPTTTSMAGATVDCIRIRPRKPGADTQDSPPIVEEGAQQHEEEPPV